MRDLNVYVVQTTGSTDMRLQADFNKKNESAELNLFETYQPLQVVAAGL